MEDIGIWLSYLLGFVALIFFGLLGMIAGSEGGGASYSSSSSPASCFDDDDNFIINHATGSPMVGGVSGQDAFGNNFGCNSSMFNSSGCSGSVMGSGFDDI
ncbi:hypothetical protein [Aliiglaciecola sp. M165]|uniref:hypothetical protein n=1 Tax=Aliiglaciecola sp. M165 TaxID=2593649 RepID=UPI001180236A|nr:hypothetical protein [Aliiglaciecola sp. M165]TRY29776.1 hypothetical protein FM019_16525 [Aliiglaciecola sp. M165]